MIEAVLIDADGVIQRRPDGWRTGLGQRLGFEGDTDAFLADLFAEEIPALVCGAGINDGLARVLQRWACQASLEEALRIWTAIEAEAGIPKIIAGLRSRGIRCFLASNQETYKANYMSRVLGYGTLFDEEFYSWSIGHKKPDQAYFETIAARIGIAPDRLLFIDDREPNVRAAQEVGLVASQFTRFGGARELLRILRSHGLDPSTNSPNTD